MLVLLSASLVSLCVAFGLGESLAVFEDCIGLVVFLRRLLLVDFVVLIVLDELNHLYSLVYELAVIDELDLDLGGSEPLLFFVDFDLGSHVRLTDLVHIGVMQLGVVEVGLVDVLFFISIAFFVAFCLSQKVVLVQVLGVDSCD